MHYCLRWSWSFEHSLWESEHLHSGIARNYRQGVRQSVAFLSVHSRSAALPSLPYNQKTSWHIYCLNDWTNNDVLWKLCIFLTGGAYATCMATPLHLHLNQTHFLYIRLCRRCLASKSGGGGQLLEVGPLGVNLVNELYNAQGDSEVILSLIYASRFLPAFCG